MRRGGTPEICDGEEEEGEEEAVEGGFLDDEVEEDGDGEEAEEEAGDEGGFGVEELASGLIESEAGESAQDGLDNADSQEGWASDFVDEGEEVGVEGGLVEGLGADPVAGLDEGESPFVVGLGVA